MLRHFLTSKESLNPIFFFSEKTYFTSYVRKMFWATILFKYPCGTDLKIKIERKAKKQMLFYLLNIDSMAYFSLKKIYYYILCPYYFVFKFSKSGAMLGLGDPRDCIYWSSKDIFFSFTDSFFLSRMSFGLFKAFIYIKSNSKSPKRSHFIMIGLKKALNLTI